MTDPLTATNSAIAEASSALYRSLSPLGRRVVYPPDIPFQAAQARGKAYNATIGQITDGHGKILSLPAVEKVLAGWDESHRNSALLYSPIEGMDELRHEWRRWHRSSLPPDGGPTSSLPLVTAGLTHGLSLVADLFGQPGRKVLVPKPCWGNYWQIFAARTGAELLYPAAYDGDVFRPTALAEAAEELPEDEPALAILNLPSNPGGYSPTVSQRRALVESLIGAAHRRPLIVLVDDAYAGLVYEEDIPRQSLFWDLVDRHPNLVPVKVDGSTKELVLFGARVGFLTFPFAPDSAIARALESKVKCLVRSTIGSPVALSQVVLLQALHQDKVAQEVEAIRALLKSRYDALRRALAEGDPDRIHPLPFNSGVFALLRLPADLDPEAVRRHLLDAQDTGVVSVAPHYLRIAFCSVAAPALAELVRRIERGIGELLKGPQ